MKNDKFTFFNEVEFQDLGGGVRRKILAYGEDLMQVYLEFEEGAEGKVHSHPHTQLTHILEGEFEFTIGGEVKRVHAGDTLLKLPNVPHGCVCTKKGKMLDTFTPMRKDFVGEE